MIGKKPTPPATDIEIQKMMAEGINLQDPKMKNK